MKYSETIVKGIETYLKEKDWSFEYDMIHGTFSVEADLECKLETALVVFQVTEEGFLSYTTIDEEADAAIRSMVGEYLHRANYGLPNGNFEFDYDSGEIHFKTYCACPDGIPAKPQLEEAMEIGLTVLDHYGDGIYQLLHSVTPAKQLINALEDQEG